MAERGTAQEGIAAVVAAREEPVFEREFFRQFEGSMRVVERVVLAALDRAALATEIKRDVRFAIQNDLRDMRRRIERIAQCGMVIKEPNVVEFSEGSLQRLAALLAEMRGGDGAAAD